MINFSGSENRLRDWQEAGIWDLIHFAVLDWLSRYSRIDCAYNCYRAERSSAALVRIRRESCTCWITVLEPSISWCREPNVVPRRYRCCAAGNRRLGVLQDDLSVSETRWEMNAWQTGLNSTRNPAQVSRP